MTEQEIKRTILFELKKAVQAEEVKKTVKMFKCIYGQWDKATEDDIILLPMKDMPMQKITLFTFEVRRYYQFKLSSGNYGEIRMDDIFTMNNKILGYPDAIYNIDKPGISDIKKDIFRRVVDQKDTMVLFNNYLGDMYTLNAELEYKTEAHYKSANERWFYNNPQKLARMTLGNWRFEEYEDIPTASYSAILLKLKGKKMMYVGRFNESKNKAEKIDISANASPYNPIVFDEADKKVSLQKGLFGWKI